jgi:hypothetical protein
LRHADANSYNDRDGNLHTDSDADTYADAHS